MRICDVCGKSVLKGEGHDCAIDCESELERIRILEGQLNQARQLTLKIKMNVLGEQLQVHALLNELLGVLGEDKTDIARSSKRKV